MCRTFKQRGNITDNKLVFRLFRHLLFGRWPLDFHKWNKSFNWHQRWQTRFYQIISLSLHTQRGSGKSSFEDVGTINHTPFQLNMVFLCVGRTWNNWRFRKTEMACCCRQQKAQRTYRRRQIPITKHLESPGPARHISPISPKFSND